jgi:hypothetical protein
MTFDPKDKARVADTITREVDRLRELLAADGVCIVALWHNPENGDHEIIDGGYLPPCITAQQVYALLVEDEDTEDLMEETGAGRMLS